MYLRTYAQCRTGCLMPIAAAFVVSAVGSHKGLKQVRRIVEDCMNNVHPVYNIKILMIKRELSRDDELKSENWDRFTPFPPLPPQSKVDKQLESGEYFLSERGKSKRSVHEKKEAAAQKSARKRQERAKDYIPPPAEKYALRNQDDLFQPPVVLSTDDSFVLHSQLFPTLESQASEEGVRSTRYGGYEEQHSKESEGEGEKFILVQRRKRLPFEQPM
mmetsp:Transcript_7023/g.30881  ORF Transcript_7023/g.30881 Transcript_7023/m.30881 type:complete len:217 (-) Transcript_7023:273-923(-)